jgi:hypothetical protein
VRRKCFRNDPVGFMHLQIAPSGSRLQWLSAGSVCRRSDGGPDIEQRPTIGARRATKLLHYYGRNNSVIASGSEASLVKRVGKVQSSADWAGIASMAEGALQRPDDKLWADWAYPQVGTAFTALQCLEASKC